MASENDKPMKKTVSAIAILIAATAMAWPWGDSGFNGHSRHMPPPPDYAHGHWGDSGWGRWHGYGDDFQPHRDHDRHGRHDDRHDNRKGKAKYRLVGEFTPPGGGLEVQLGGGCTAAYIEVSSGTVSFNTAVLRRGGQKQSVTISARLEQGQRYDLPVDEAVTGIRISCSGKGRFKVYAR